MNKKYIGQLDIRNEIEVFEFDHDWEEYWSGLFKQNDEYRIEDDVVFYVGDSEEEVEEKLKEYLVEEILITD